MKTTLSAILFTLGSLSTSVQADPTVFGLTLGKTTSSELTALHSAELVGINAYSDGPAYEVSTNTIDFDGLQELTVIFNRDGILEAVLAKLPKDRFKDLNAMLGKKYKRVSQNVPFVGNASARFRDGKTDIVLDAPHLSFTLSLSYLRDSFMKSFKEKSKAQEEAKRTGEASQL